MSPKRTYIDAGVLIAAARGRNDVSNCAMQILDDPNREFVTSLFLKLEVFPKAVYEKRQEEREFYETFFEAVTCWADSFESIIENAYLNACEVGLAAMDALHVSAAISAGAEELVTTEKPDKPIHRAKSIKIFSIQPTINPE